MAAVKFLHRFPQVIKSSALGQFHVQDLADHGSIPRQMHHSVVGKPPGYQGGVLTVDFFNQNLLYGDYGFAYTWQNVAALFLFIPAALLLLPRLKRAVLSHRYENID